jgi:hypothetical protein
MDYETGGDPSKHAIMQTHPNGGHNETCYQYQRSHAHYDATVATRFQRDRLPALEGFPIGKLFPNWQLLTGGNVASRRKQHSARFAYLRAISWQRLPRSASFATR